MLNIQPGDSCRKRSVRRRETDTSIVETLGKFFSKVWTIALVLLVFGGLFHTYIKFDQDINEISSEIQRVNERIAMLDRDIDGLKGDYANCTSRSFIIGQIRRFKLNLEPIRYDQQHSIRIYSDEQLARLPYPLPLQRVVTDRRRP